MAKHKARKTASEILERYSGDLTIKEDVYISRGRLVVSEAANLLLINPFDAVKAAEVLEAYNEIRNSPLMKALL